MMNDVEMLLEAMYGPGSDLAGGRPRAHLNCGSLNGRETVDLKLYYG